MHMNGKASSEITICTFALVLESLMIFPKLLSAMMVRLSRRIDTAEHHTHSFQTTDGYWFSVFLHTGD